MAYVNPGIAMGVQTYQPPSLMNTAAKATDIGNALVNRQAVQQDMERAQYAQALKQSRDALSFVSTPEQYMAWHEANHQNPVLGSMLAKMGISADQGRAKIEAELRQPGGLERLIQQSAASTAQLTDIMSGRLNAMAAQQKAAAGQARTAEQQAAVNAVMGSGAAAPATTPALSAQALPVAPPVDTRVYEPGTSGAINQLYAQSRAAPVPALNALAAQPTASADSRMAQLARLDNLAMQGNAQAANAAKILREQLKFEQEMTPSQDPTKRFLNVGEGVVFDTQTQKYIPNPERKPKVGTPVPIVGPSGDVILVPPEEAIGKTPGSQAEKVPKDFRRTSDGGLEIIPGSPTDRKNKENANVGAQTIDAAIDNINKLIGPVGQFKEHPGLRSATGPLDVKTPTLFTDTANAEAYIQSLQAKASLEGLRTIRGQAGAIGQITEREWPRLENLLATLQASQGTDQFVQSLNEYRSALLDVKNQIKAASSGTQTSSQTVSVTAPNGQTYTFANQKAANDFKKAAGIK